MNNEWEIISEDGASTSLTDHSAVAPCCRDFVQGKIPLRNAIHRRKDNASSYLVSQNVSEIGVAKQRARNPRCSLNGGSLVPRIWRLLRSLTTNQRRIRAANAARLFNLAA